MNTISFLLIIALTAFASFQMTKEKGQSIIWVAATIFVGPMAFIVQYLFAYFKGRQAKSI